MALRTMKPTVDLRDDAFWDGPTPADAQPVRSARYHRGRAGADRLETRGRARALQALYAADLRGIQQLRRIASHVFDDLAVEPAEREFASRLVATVAEYTAEIDAEMAQVTDNWRLERLGAIERSVLRLGAAELRRGETPVRVVIQEAVRLAERYGTQHSARFVNGVLDAHARRTGKL